MSRDIEEGALFFEMPKFGMGRIRSRADLRERYFTVCIWKYRLFIVRLFSNGWKWRGYFVVNNVAVRAWT